MEEIEKEPQWCFYNIQNKILTNLNLSNKEIKGVVFSSTARVIVHWSSESTPGNDIFYLSNFKKLHLQSEQLSEIGFQKPIQDTSLRLELLSHDETKYLSSINYREIYLNSNRLTIGINNRDFRFSKKIHWSDDSKYFSTQVAIEDYEPVIRVLSPAV